MKQYNRKKIVELNRELREKYEYCGGDKIRHYQGDFSNMTYIRVNRMPNSNQPGWMFVGYTDELLQNH